MAIKLIDALEPIVKLKKRAKMLNVIRAFVETGVLAAVIEGRPDAFLTIEDAAEEVRLATNLFEVLASPPPLKPQRFASHDRSLASVLRSVPEKYIFVTRGDSVLGVVTPRSAFKALSARVRLSDIGRTLRSADIAVLWPHTTIKGALRKMARERAVFAVVHTRGRVRGVLSLHMLLGLLVRREILDRVMRGDDGYYLDTTVASIPCDRRTVFPHSELTKRKIVEVLSRYGNLVVTRAGYLEFFFSDSSLHEYVRSLAVRTP